MYETLSHQELRDLNKNLDNLGRQHCAKIAAVWHEIESRGSWKVWGYVSFVDSVTEEAPRSLTTINELITNYRFFVIKHKFSYTEFEDLMMRNGMRKVTMIRREDTVHIPEVQVVQTDALVPQIIEPTPEKKKARIQSVATKVEKLSVSGAAKMVKETAAKNGVTVYQAVGRRYSFTPEQDALVQEAISHIKSRVRGDSTMSDSSALSYVCSEYLSANAMRRMVG